MLIRSAKHHFVCASDDFSKQLAESVSDTNYSEFYGYCFKGSTLHHDRFSCPRINELFASYASNCGVFCALYRKSENETIVFTDPLGQYPVFYYEQDGRFFVSNDFWEISKSVSSRRINEDVIYDYVTYFSPLNQETLSYKVRRLTAHQILQIRKTSSGYTFNVCEMPELRYDGTYDDLLIVGSERFKERATAVLALGQPVVHLTGGADSRLSFSALAACGYKGPVFSFGNGFSQDRLVHQSLVQSMKLEQGSIKWFGGAINSTYKLLHAVKAFNGLKSNNLTNWASGESDRHLEVTGYFGEGLLKGFGQFWGPNRTASPFKYAKTVSAFPSQVFDHVEKRIQAQSKEILERHDGNLLLAETEYYLRNRSAAHFGAHSVVNNRKFVSVDLIYDPMLTSLLRVCPYPEKAIKDGAILIDLIKLIHSEELAIFPYDDRFVTSYDRRSDALYEIGTFSCFSNLRLMRKELQPLNVDIHQTASRENEFSFAEVKISSLSEIITLEPFAELIRTFPLLDLSHLPKCVGEKRALERISLSSLSAAYWLLNQQQQSCI